MCTEYTVKKSTNNDFNFPQNFENKTRVRQKKVFAPIPMSKLDPGFSSRYKNLVSVVA